MDRYHYEHTLWKQGYTRIMGLDEVGRGCLSGPVVAAGVIIKPESHLNEKIADSKSIGLNEREFLAEEIKKTALFWSVHECPPRVIDEINILKASIRAMLNCTEADGANPDYLLVDGNRFTSTVVPYSCIIKGDDKSVSIAAASILAKVHRDRLMKKLHKEYPVYGWDSNVGYPTKTHFDGLNKYGYTKHHRKSFKLRTEKKFDGL
ncbi:MAG: ribonuclease HII [Balneolaceae bacterium]|nr:ribonuclease HII [Balneolaceae bacterium]